MHLNTPGNGKRFGISDGHGGYVTFSSTLPRTTPAILGRGTRDSVAWWAETQLGVTSYHGLCYAFAQDAWRFGAKIDPGWAESAISKWHSLPKKVRRSGEPARGAMVFWDYGRYGHVAISAGRGYVVSSYFGGTSRISWAGVNSVTRTSGGRYLGWWLPA